MRPTKYVKIIIKWYLLQSLHWDFKYFFGCNFPPHFLLKFSPLWQCHLIDCYLSLNLYFSNSLWNASSALIDTAIWKTLDVKTLSENSLDTNSHPRKQTMKKWTHVTIYFIFFKLQNKWIHILKETWMEHYLIMSI